jgi:ABC-type polar amino acid transport system ATPase subunit
MIKLGKIEKCFGEHRVLGGVDLTLAPGNVTALIGPSGSGKSTLLRCVNLLEIPEGGSLELGSSSAASTNPRATRCWRSGAAPAWCFRTSSCFRI